MTLLLLVELVVGAPMEDGLVQLLDCFARRDLLYSAPTLTASVSASHAARLRRHVSSANYERSSGFR